jgi:undecaprenyl-diphosphatase
MISERLYRHWQSRLKTSPLFRGWWQFWSNYAFVFFIPAFAWIGLQREPYMVIGLCAISFFLTRAVFTTLINKYYKRPRPYQIYKFEPITSIFFSLKDPMPDSFPSRHTGAYSAVAFTIFTFFPALGLALVGVTLMTGIARVILGYHYPSDILGGFLLGVIVGITVASIGPFTIFT